LLPVLTNGAQLYSQKLAYFHFWAHLLGGIGMGAFMGMAGLQGMLRRTIYFDGEFSLYMILAGLCGLALLAAFAAFFFNIVMTVGLKGVLGIFSPSKLDEDELLPAAAGCWGRRWMWPGGWAAGSGGTWVWTPSGRWPPANWSPKPPPGWSNRWVSISSNPVTKPLSWRPCPFF
jgi:hypothetical protein